MKNKLLLLILSSCLFLSACSSQFAYNNMDWLVHWYLDDYVDLDKGQKKLFDNKMQGWLSWHRKQELALYQQHLQQLKQDVNQPHISPETWLKHFEQGRGHWLRLRDTLSPDLYPLVLELTDEQIEDLFAELAEQTEQDLSEYQEFMQKDEQAKLKQRVKDRQDDSKRWIGKLNQQQKQLIADYAPRFQSTFTMWMQYRQLWQQQAKAALLQRQEQGFRQTFEQLMLQPEILRTQEYQDALEHNRQLQAQLLSELFDTLTAKQKKRLNRELDDLIDDMIELQQD